MSIQERPETDLNTEMQNGQTPSDKLASAVETSSPDLTNLDLADDAQGNHKKESVSELLIRIGDEAPNERLTVRDLVVSLEDRAFGFLLLILAIPCAVPFLYGVPQAVSLPLIFVAVQIVLGRHRLWLPKTLTKRSFAVEDFRKMTARAVPYLRWFEKISSPRLTWLTKGRIEQVLGVFLLAFSCSIAVPLPGTNTLPGIAVALVALGFIERDGLLTIAGLILGTAWVTLLATVGYEALSLAKDWITGLF